MAKRKIQFNQTGEKEELTDRQRELYEFIWDKSNWRLLPPSYKQMMAFLKHKSPGSVALVLKYIRYKGWDIPVYIKDN